MKDYIALTLLYDRRQTRVDPETGVLVEHGYVQPGETIALDDEPAAILLELGDIAVPPEPAAPVVEEDPAPKKRRES